MFFLLSKNLLFTTLLLSILALACQSRERLSSAQMANDSAITSAAPAPSQAEPKGGAAEKDALNPFSASVAVVSSLDYRNVRAEEVALKMMEDQLLQRRQSIYQQNIYAAAQTGKSATQLEAADRTLSSRAAADQSRIERLKLEDAIQYK